MVTGEIGFWATKPYNIIDLELIKSSYSEKMGWVKGVSTIGYSDIGFQCLSHIKESSLKIPNLSNAEECGESCCCDTSADTSTLEYFVQLKDWNDG